MASRRENGRRSILVKGERTGNLLQRLVKGYVEYYNDVCLNSAIGYITPKDMLAGHQQEIPDGRDWKLEAAREQRKNRRQLAV